MPYGEMSDTSPLPVKDYPLAFTSDQHAYPQTLAEQDVARTMYWVF